MAANDPYSNLRGGVLTSVTGLTPSTISSWGLQLGDRRREGYPRYTIADVVAAVLMKELTLGTTLKASRAAYIVRELQPKLPKLVERVRAEWKESGKWSAQPGGPYLLVGGGVHGRSPNEGVKIAVIEQEQVAEVIAGAEVSSLIIVPMRRIIKIAMFALTRDDIQEG